MEKQKQDKQSKDTTIKGRKEWKFDSHMQFLRKLHREKLLFFFPSELHKQQIQ